MAAATRLQIHSISSSSSSSQTDFKNVVGIYLPTTILCSIILRQQTRSPTYRRGRREPFRREMFLSNGSSLSLSRLSNTCYYNTIYRTFSQVPFILSHPTWISSLQEKMFVDSDFHMGIIVISHSPSEELFALDPNMETVLDDCRVDLSCDLVVDVLERFIQTYPVLINCWCKAGNEMIHKGLNPDIVVYNTMLEGLLKVHERSDAVKLFGIMKTKGPSPNERSYMIMIKDLCKQKRMEEAVEYYESMLSDGCILDAAVYTCLITGFGNQKQMDKVYGLLKEMKEKGCPTDGRMYNALIKLMTNRQKPDDAVRLYKKMILNDIEPTIRTYNMMLKSFFRTENYEIGTRILCSYEDLSGREDQWKPVCIWQK